MSTDWLSQRRTSDAEAEAQERLERYQTEREERMATYKLSWERKWAQQRAAVATPDSRGWRIVK